jgi:hypothetical protein
MLIYTRRETNIMVCDGANDFSVKNRVQIIALGWKKQTFCYVLSLRAGCGRSRLILVVLVSDSFKRTRQGPTICDGRP